MPPTSTLKERLQNDSNAALRAGDKARLSLLRLTMAAIKQCEVDSRKNLTDDGVLSLLGKMIKQQKASISLFKQGGRHDLVTKEELEIAILKEYLPEQLDESTVLTLVNEIIAATDSSSLKDMGRVMDELKKRAAGQVDMSKVSELVKDRLVR